MEILILIILCGFVLLCFFHIVLFLNNENKKKNDVLKNLDKKFENLENDHDCR